MFIKCTEYPRLSSSAPAAALRSEVKIEPGALACWHLSEWGWYQQRHVMSCGEHGREPNVMGSQTFSTKEIVPSANMPNICQTMTIDRKSHFTQKLLNVLSQACLQHAYIHVHVQEMASFQALKKGSLDSNNPEYAEMALAYQVPYLDDIGID
ncbi:hypothetical protein WJX77_005714 [Trebouxia sp. C0004]